MKKTKLFLLTLVAFLLLNACKKSNKPPTPPVESEEKIAFTIDIDPGSAIFSALGATQDAKIIVGSKIPTAGVNLDLTVKKDSDNSVVSSTTLSSTISSFTSTISNLQPGVVCTATFTVTSKSTPTNTLVKSFKIARK